eukprot:COSAG01_NODE_33368_length_565_cov_1.122318_1_plen_135_part_10
MVAGPFSSFCLKSGLKATSLVDKIASVVRPSDAVNKTGSEFVGDLEEKKLKRKRLDLDGEVPQSTDDNLDPTRKRGKGFFSNIMVDGKHRTFEELCVEAYESIARACTLRVGGTAPVPPTCDDDIWPKWKRSNVV